MASHGESGGQPECAGSDVKVAVGAPIVLSPTSAAVWHLPVSKREFGRTLEDAFEVGTRGWPSLCGLDGPLYAYAGEFRERRLCAVCRGSGPLEHPIPGEEMPPADTCGVCRRIVEQGELAAEEEGFIYHAACYAAAVPPILGRSRWTVEQLQALYLLRYLRDGLTVAEAVDPYWRAKGFADAAAAVSSATQVWRRVGWPLRDRSEAMRSRYARRPKALLATRKLPVDEARALHPVHWEGWQSINAIAAANCERLGMTRSALASQLSYTWKILGLPAHDRIEMTVHVSTRHGLKRRKGSSSAVYKRYLAEQRGERYARPCEALTTSGKPCLHLALKGKTVCHSHDPARVDATRARLADMRARSPKHRPENLEPVADVQADLAAYWQWAGRWKPLVEASGFSNTQLRRWLVAPPETRILKTTGAWLHRALLELTPVLALPSAPLEPVGDLEVAA